MYNLLRKIIKINKDIIFMYIVVFWMFSNTLTYIFFGDEGVMISNTVFIVLMTIFIIIMKRSKKINDWLNKDYWE